MERLTERLENGVIQRTPVTDGNRGESIMSRLAAYEDTGLEPGEIEEMQREWVVLKQLAEELKVMCDFGRFRELAQADREGRVVVHRFSPGQTVWVVERDEDGEACELSGYVFVASVNGVALVSPTINNSSDIDVILSNQIEQTAFSCNGDLSAYPLDDCYLTREEAEEALGGGNQ